jgi:hypothetical protein
VWAAKLQQSWLSLRDQFHCEKKTEKSSFGRDLHQVVHSKLLLLQQDTGGCKYRPLLLQERLTELRHNTHRTASTNVNKHYCNTMMRTFIVLLFTLFSSTAMVVSSEITGKIVSCPAWYVLAEPYNQPSLGNKELSNTFWCLYVRPLACFPYFAEP